MKPICPKCQRFFRAKKNGYAFLEGMPNTNSAKPGTENADQWSP